MTRETLEALKELEAKATAGPWWVELSQDGIPLVKYKWDDVPTWIAEASNRENNRNDFAFICSARNNLFQLLRIAEAMLYLKEQAEYSIEYYRGDSTQQRVATCPKMHPSSAKIILREYNDAIGGDDAR